MGLHRFKPMPSGRMGIFWTLSSIKNSAVVEFGCMGHNLYSGWQLRQAGVYEGLGAPLYTTYIDETDIAMGDTARLDETIAQVVRSDRPEVIFLQPSAVPEVIGMDMIAAANELRDSFPETQIVAIGHASFAISQHKGVENALSVVVKSLARDVRRTERPTYNVLGTCPDLYNFGADLLELERVMRGAFSMEPVCRLSSSCSVEDIRAIGSAHVNLVIRREGLPAARYLNERFGTPFVFCRPYGIDGTSRWLRQVGEALGTDPDSAFISSEEELARMQIFRARRVLESNAWTYPEEETLTIGGHCDVVKGIMEYATREMPLKKGICWCDCPEMGDDDVPYFSEKEWMPVVSAHKKGYLMFTGEALKWYGKNTLLQISNPDFQWRLHPYGVPFVGYHGAVHLLNLWINEHAATH